MTNIFNKIFNTKIETKSFEKNNYMFSIGGQYRESNNSFANIAYEAYCNNVIANRCVNLIASNMSSLQFKLYENNKELGVHDSLFKAIYYPNATNCFEENINHLICYYLIAGESYLLALRNITGEIIGLKNIRPDIVSIKKNQKSVKTHYLIAGDHDINLKINPITGASDLFVFKNFHPLDEDSGISQIEACMNSIIQHNLAGKWNLNLLKNGARPSGALVLKDSCLSDKEFERLKEQIMDCLAGADNTGKPLLLENGIDWKEICLSPKDMDFLESKNMAAREIALAMGVPPQLLAIPGDNKFSNYKEARESFWEETIMPLASKLAGKLSCWLSSITDKNLVIKVENVN